MGKGRARRLMSRWRIGRFFSQMPNTKLATESTSLLLERRAFAAAMIEGESSRVASVRCRLTLSGSRALQYPSSSHSEESATPSAPSLHRGVITCDITSSHTRHLPTDAKSHHQFRCRPMEHWSFRSRFNHQDETCERGEIDEQRLFCHFLETGRRGLCAAEDWTTMLCVPPLS